MLTRACANFLVATCVSIMGAAPAHADEAEAVQQYKLGRKAYDLGRFQAAIEHFSLAYEAKAAPEFLFNIAQSHRQLGNCPRALFFYRRYLRLSPQSPQALEVSRRIETLQGQCPDPVPQTQTATQAAPPPAPMSAPTQDPAPDPTRAPRPVPDDPRWSVSVEGGVGLATLGDLDVPAQLTTALSTTYALRLGPTTLRLGALGTLFLVPYDAAGSHTAWMTQVLAQSELSVPLLQWLALRVEAGLGLLLFSGLGPDNPFTEGGAPTSGPLSMFAARVAVGLDVRLATHLRLRLSPAAFSFSPRKVGLLPQIKRVTRLDLGAGLSFDF